MKKSRRLPTGTFSVLLDLSESSNSFIIEISKDIQKKDRTEFVFDGKRYHPHITLYLFAAPLRNRRKILKKALQLSKRIHSTELSIVKLVSSRDGWVIADLEESELFRKYHRETVSAINPLREGMLRKKYRNPKFLASFPKEQQESLLKYGDRHAMKLFHPHISLAKTENGDVATKIVNRYKDKIEGESVKISGLKVVRDIGREKGRTITIFVNNFK